VVLPEPQPKNHHHQQLGFGFNDSTNVCPTDLQIITINPVELAPQKLKTHSKFPFLSNYSTLYAVAALHQGAPGQMTWLKDPPPWLCPA